MHQLEKPPIPKKQLANRLLTAQNSTNSQTAFRLKKVSVKNTDKIFRQFNDNPIFQSKTDEDKVKALSGALTDINSAGKATIMLKQPQPVRSRLQWQRLKVIHRSTKIVTGDYDVTSKLIGQDLPKNMNKEAVNVLASYDKAKAKDQTPTNR